MDEKSFKIRIKIGNNEIEATGSPKEVYDTLQNLPKIIEKMATAFRIFSPTNSISASEKLEFETTEAKDFPTISVKMGISCPEAIIMILSTEWGREKPRHLGEIMEAMKMNALHFPIGTVKGRLTDLTKKGLLRRIKGEKGYNYIVTN